MQLKYGWTRAIEKENRGKEHVDPDKKDMFYFECSPQLGRDAALLVLSPRDTNVLFVLNVLPLEKDALSPGEYNSILKDFYDAVILPLPSSFESELEVEYYDPDKHLPDEVGSNYGVAVHLYKGKRIWW